MCELSGHIKSEVKILLCEVFVMEHLAVCHTTSNADRKLNQAKEETYCFD
jgi:hypothetical protein